jgi:hypothetical protein
VEEKRKNRILLSIFLLAVVGFAVLIYFSPPFADPTIFYQASFPPSAHDLYRISQVSRTQYRC